MQKFVTRAISIARHNSVTYVCARVMKIGLYDSRLYNNRATCIVISQSVDSLVLSLSLSLYLSIEYLENFFRSVLSQPAAAIPLPIDHCFARPHCVVSVVNQSGALSGER